MMKIEPRGKVLIDGEGYVSICEGGYEVEMILDSRVYKGVIYYLVKWAGYGVEEATWEKKMYLRHLPEMIKDYEKSKEATSFKSRYRSVKALSQRTKFWGDVPSESEMVIIKQQKNQLTKKNTMNASSSVREHTQIDHQSTGLDLKEEVNQNLQASQTTIKKRQCDEQEDLKPHQMQSEILQTLKLTNSDLTGLLSYRPIKAVRICKNNKEETEEYYLVSRDRYRDYQFNSMSVYEENAERATKIWEKINNNFDNFEEYI